MTLRNMPLPTVEVLFDEIRNYATCDSCDEVKMCEKRSDYIVDIDEDVCETRDIIFYTEMARKNIPKMHEANLTKTKNLCHSCLLEFNEDYLEELDKYK